MKRILKYIGKAGEKGKDGIVYGCDYLHVLGLNIDFNKSIGDSLLFQELLTPEEERYIRETLSFYVNLLNKNEEKNRQFVNEVAEFS